MSSHNSQFESTVPNVFPIFNSQACPHFFISDYYFSDLNCQNLSKNTASSETYSPNLTQFNLQASTTVFLSMDYKSTNEVFDNFANGIFNLKEAVTRLSDAPVVLVVISDVYPEFAKSLLDNGFISMYYFILSCTAGSDPRAPLINECLLDVDTNLRRSSTRDEHGNNVRCFSFFFTARLFFAGEYLGALFADYGRESGLQCIPRITVSEAVAHLERCSSYVPLEVAASRVLQGLAVAGAVWHVSPSSEMDTATSFPSISSIAFSQSNQPAETFNREVACLVMDAARYRNVKTGKLIDLPLRVVVRTGFATLFLAVFDCSVEGLLELDVSDLRAIASFGVYASSLRKYDEAIQRLSKIIAECFIILHDHEAVFETLCLEILTHLFFDVGNNVLVRNDALRRGGHCWSRTRSRCVPLRDLWLIVAHCDVPEDLIQRADGLLAIHNRVAPHLPSQVANAGAATQPSIPWNSVPPMWRPLKRILNIESVSDVDKHPRISRSFNPVPSLPAVPKPVPLFHFEVKLGFAEDTFKSATVNALLRALPLSGVALVDFLRDRHLLQECVIDNIVAVHRERFAVAEQDEMAYVLDVSTPDGADPFIVQDALLEFLKLNDEKLFARARNVDFPGVRVPAL